MSEPWDAATGGADERDWVAEARPGIVLGLCAFAIAVAGLTGFAVWPQMWFFGFVPRGFFQTVWPPLVTLLGLLSIPVGASIAGGRMWAAVSAAPLMLLLTITSGVWVIYCTVNLVFSPMYLWLMMITPAGLIASVVGLALSVRVDRARKALLAD